MKDRTPIWVKTDTVSSYLNNSSLPHKKKKRTVPVATTNIHNERRDQAIGRSPNLAVDWGWARGHILSRFSVSQQLKIKATSRKVFKSESKASLLSNTDVTPILSDGSINIIITDKESEYDGQEITIDFKDAMNSVVMANSSEEDHNEEIDPPDLMNLTHLHEPAVVHALRERYSMDKIYTSTGPILIAVNPCKPCVDLYTEKVMSRYTNFGEKKSRGVDIKEKLSPHVYAVADRAFRNIMRDLDVKDIKNCDQTILVSGESGAGKTVTSKIIMSYLANLSNKVQHTFGKTYTQGEVGIEQQVLQSNPILESFGNARTIRNDNSSRFGKFIELQFKASGSLIGASIDTYLLEKVRLISQSPGERNYHIFYEILAGASRQERKDFLLHDFTAKDFRMTSISKTYDRRDKVEDADTYTALRKGMETMGFTTDEQKNILHVSCALLHLSNITFREVSEEKSQLNFSDKVLKPALHLLGVTDETLNESLCTCTFSAAGEVFSKDLTVEQASKAMEAFIKATYGSLFTYIVGRINEFITSKENGEVSNVHKVSTIGVLDIFGFESFRTNSFEHLCINYCNEALQQQFNRFVFKLEQQEYEREGIKWSFIEFPDNQDVLDLIDKKHFGILSVLDEQCRLAKCTDRTFVHNVYQKCSEHPRFLASTAQKVSGLFSLYHYAGAVEYDSKSFLEKNKDELPKETTDILKNSSNPFFSQLANILTSSQSSSSPKSSDFGNPKCKNLWKRQSSTLTRPSVGSQFRAQLAQLRERIDRTSPHYVRCLKPNDFLIPNTFDQVVISDQLRYAGVLEAIRVARVAYPQRYTHLLFIERYRILALKESNELSIDESKESYEARVISVAQQVWDAQNVTDFIQDIEVSMKSKRCKPCASLISVGIQMGKTKVFLRQRAFDTLERLRNQKIELSCSRIQSLARMYSRRRRYQCAREATLKLQRFFCRFIVEKFRNDKIQISSSRIQSIARMYLQRQIYQFTRAKIASSRIQSVARMSLQRNRYRSLLHYRAMEISFTQMQSVIRMYLQRKRYLSALHYHRIEIASNQIQSVARLFLQRKRCQSALSVLRCIFSGYIARFRVEKVRRERAVITIQTNWRMLRGMAYLNASCYIARFLQKMRRGQIARKNVRSLVTDQRRNSASVVLQSSWRAFNQSCRYTILQYLVLRLQCIVRSHNARKVLEKLNMKAKSIDYILSVKEILRHEEHILESLTEARRKSEKAIRLRSEGDLTIRQKSVKERDNHEDGEDIESWTERVAARKRSIFTSSSNEAVTDDLQNAILLLRKQLALVVAQKSPKIVFQDFPKNPTIQERELNRLTKENHQLRRENISFKRNELLHQLTQENHQLQKENAVFKARELHKVTLENHQLQGENAFFKKERKGKSLPFSFPLCDNEKYHLDCASSASSPRDMIAYNSAYYLGPHCGIERQILPGELDTTHSFELLENDTDDEEDTSFSGDPLNWYRLSIAASSAVLEATGEEDIASDVAAVVLSCRESDVRDVAETVFSALMEKGAYEKKCVIVAVNAILREGHILFPKKRTENKFNTVTSSCNNYRGHPDEFKIISEIDKNNEKKGLADVNHSESKIRLSGKMNEEREFVDAGKIDKKSSADSDFTQLKNFMGGNNWNLGGENFFSALFRGDEGEKRDGPPEETDKNSPGSFGDGREKRDGPLEKTVNNSPGSFGDGASLSSERKARYLKQKESRRFILGKMKRQSQAARDVTGVVVEFEER